jgi:hypothetical protein
MMACLGLCGCWVSDTRFFDSGDWAMLRLAGDYDVAQLSDGSSPEALDRATITPRPDGLVEFMPQTRVARATPTVFGFVPIAGGSGQYFLAVDRSTADYDDDDGDMYYIAKVTADGVAFFFPDCDGTPRQAGMAVEADGFTEGKTCTFTSEEALMKAALEAERFIAAPHIVGLSPFLAFSKHQEGGG